MPETADVTIKIPSKVRDLLAGLKQGRETYGDVILRLMGDRGDHNGGGTAPAEAHA